jgi:ABC-2 type transport system permease protein
MSASAVTMKHYPKPQFVIGRFVARRTLRSATFYALVFGAYVASKAAGFAAAYPSAQARNAIAATFGNNVGLDALLGAPHNMNTITGFTVWNTLGVMTLVGSVWAFLLSTKIFRGEEEAGRTELLLVGQATAVRAAANTLVGLATSLLSLFVVSSLAFILVGRIHTVNFSASAAVFFALSACMGAATFAAVGAAASQLMPTRSRAATFSAGVLGVFFLLRAMADTTSAHWLLNLTPLGWIEKLQPLYGSQPLWLLPLFGFVVLLSAVALFITGHRDLGDSVFADKDVARPHFGLLNTPFGAAVRLTRAKTVGWLVSITLMALAFGLLTKSAAAAFGASERTLNVINRLTQSTQTAGATAFLGIMFFMLMLLIMSYAASAVGAIRETEAEGYVDNLLVRPVGRLQWLWGRVFLVVGCIVIAGLLGSLGAWVGTMGQHLGLSSRLLLEAGLNAMAPAICTLGIGIFGLGFLPRQTTLIAYSVIAWSFLIEMVSSGLNINHWILDTSVLHHVALVPAADPRWDSALILVALGGIATLLGAWRFHSRDLQNE